MHKDYKAPHRNLGQVFATKLGMPSAGDLGVTVRHGGPAGGI